MKNPFKKKKAIPKIADIPAPSPSPEPQPEEPIAEPVEHSPLPAAKEPEDDFTEWCRSQVRGGIERRERNDIYEAYTVYGADGDGRFICRRYHRYPEHEKDYDLSYSRVLTFDELNRRLLAELDKGDVKLAAYHTAMQEAARLTDPADSSRIDEFTDEEQEVLQAFCDGMDNLKDKSYLHRDGVLCCECESAAGGERLNLRFRKLLPCDALHATISGVRKEEISGYDIDNIWILGVFNRLKERAAACRVFSLTAEWSLQKESLYLILAEGFPAVRGDVLIAVGGSESFARFGFYSLDFSNK